VFRDPALRYGMVSLALSNGEENVIQGPRVAVEAAHENADSYHRQLSVTVWANG
jgi:hypothetical protein